MVSAPTKNAAPGLRWDAVKLLAEQEYCSVVHAPADPSKPGTFCKHDPVTNAYIRIDVRCAEATAEVTLDHPRQGKMRHFFRDVDRKLLREIFRDPRERAGYSDLRGRRTRQDACASFAFGDVVQVHGYGQLGCARVTGVKDHITGLVKIQFGDRQEYRVHPKQLAKAHLGPKPDPPRMGKCLTLRNEVKLQLKRVDRELEMLQQERQKLLDLHFQADPTKGQVQERNSFHHTPVDGKASPKSFSRMNLHLQQGAKSTDDGSLSSFGPDFNLQKGIQTGLFPFADTNLDLILSDSGAFAGPIQPNLSWQTRPAPEADGQGEARMILPPLDSPGLFNSN